MILAALLALSVIPQSEVITEAVDVIEVNHFHDNFGRKIFSQVVFFDFDSAKSQHVVVDWRMMKANEQRPRRVGEMFVARWRDFQDNVTRQVYATSFRETWTQVDTEMENREILPSEKRRKLARPLREPVLISGERSILR